MEIGYKAENHQGQIGVFSCVAIRLYRESEARVLGLAPAVLQLYGTLLNR